MQMNNDICSNYSWNEGDEGEWWRGWMQVWYISYIVRISAQSTSSTTTTKIQSPPSKKKKNHHNKKSQALLTKTDYMVLYIYWSLKMDQILVSLFVYLSIYSNILETLWWNKE
jgi:hypothetical protein